jgi:hypothetical protein
MHGMGWDGISSRGSPRLHDCEWPLTHIWLCSGVGTPPARLCSSVPGVWLHLCMKLGIHRLCVPWVEGRMRSRFTGSSGVLLLVVRVCVCVCVCVAWRELCQQAYIHSTCMCVYLLFGSGRSRRV